MADQSNEHWKHDTRPARNGWAPGEYGGPCRQCGQKFMDSKRSRTCADCAYAEPEPAPPADQSNEMGMVERVAIALAGHVHNGGDYGLDAQAAMLERGDDFRAQARAAIEAMTEPSPNMLEDMRHEIATTMGITLPDYALIAAWKMAVLAALSHDEVKG